MSFCGVGLSWIKLDSNNSGSKITCARGKKVFVKNILNRNEGNELDVKSNLDNCYQTGDIITVEIPGSV